MHTTETRLDSLEYAAKELYRAQAKTEEKLQHLTDEMEIFKDEMRDFKSEMRALQIKADRQREEDRVEWRKMKKEMNKKWGDLANKMGTLVEDIVIPSFHGIVKTCFGLNPEDIMFLSPRVIKRHPTIPGKEEEFDCLAWTKKYVFYNETKSSALFIYGKTS